MAQEDHSQRHSNNTSGGGGGGGYSSRYPKKLKQKKVPQRGLGVAQLEKIRLEEQQRKDHVSNTACVISPTNSSNCLPFRPTNISSPPPPSLIPCPCPNSIDVSLSKAGEIGWLTRGHHGGSWPKLWNGDYNNNIERENHGGGGSTAGAGAGAGAGFHPNVRLPYESNTPTWPLPNIRSQQPCSSSMVNVSAGTSSSSTTSVLNFQMEPPSNQSYCGNNNNNNYTPPFWPEEEKLQMVGMKRPYPFSLDNVPIPSFHCKFPSSYVSPVSKSDESASCSNGGATTSVEPPNPVFREKPSSSSAISEPIPKKTVEENGGLNGDFLTLAPPETVDLLHSSREQKQQPSTILSLHCQQLAQGTKNNPIHVTGPSNQQALISFFPSANAHTGQSSVGGRGNSNDGASTVESVDLNLRL